MEYIKGVFIVRILGGYDISGLNLRVSLTGPRIRPWNSTNFHFLKDLIEFVIRMCVHVDEEIRLTAYQSLQNLVAECPDWREDLFHIFLRFLINQIQ
uniref:Cell morphogenesis protein N-terminal domain-containing protein n=1 Tax=Meloidogyne javanica TaxID=6303 RepID=A0A915LRF5_MELJA